MSINYTSLFTKHFNCFLHKFGLDDHYFIDFLSKRLVFEELVGAEIGVQKGYNAVYMIENLPIKRLYLIDNDAEGYVKYSKMVLNSYLNSCDIIFLTCDSLQSVSQIGEFLDFVYIDGSHIYNDVYNDISNFYFITKKGGCIGGHDINTPDVTRAVFDFCKEYDKLPRIKGKDWWFCK